MLPCKYPFCPKEGVHGGWCDNHRHLAPKPFDQIPDKPYQHLYRTRKWFKFRSSFLKKNPTCFRCGGKATQVDHTAYSAKEMWEKWGDFVYEESYYSAVCQPCNTILFNQRKAGLTKKPAPPGSRSMDDLWKSCENIK